ncbi:MAG: GGDEF domain-containing protein [Burkholderiales bacterium]|nr:GGDEF domain-containing protein [Burkholderiales bacterium]
MASARLASCVRETDTLARLGGDEFTIILQDLGDTKYVELVAKEVLRQLASPFLVFDHTVRISGSIGIALSPQDSKKAEALIVNADQAMYQAKHAGRNGFSFFSPLSPKAEVVPSIHPDGNRRLDRH